MRWILLAGLIAGGCVGEPTAEDCMIERAGQYLLESTGSCTAPNGTESLFNIDPAVPFGEWSESCTVALVPSDDAVIPTFRYTWDDEGVMTVTPLPDEWHREMCIGTLTGPRISDTPL